MNFKEYRNSQEQLNESKKVQVKKVGDDYVIEWSKSSVTYQQNAGTRLKSFNYTLVDKVNVPMEILEELPAHARDPKHIQEIADFIKSEI